MKSLIAVCSYHHKNTEKVARQIAAVLGARVAAPQEIKSQDLAGYDLIGFGSGIYDGKHHQRLLALADSLTPADGKKAFLFSTDGVPRALMKNETELHNKMLKDHTPLREKLQAKGYEVTGEFGCAGFNTNAFLKYFGGINKGRPNARDLALAGDFARGLNNEGVSSAERL